MIVGGKSGCEYGTHAAGREEGMRTSGAGGRVSKNLLSPKSVSFKWPSAHSKMFSGLRSRYTMSMSCRCCRAIATCKQTRGQTDTPREGASRNREQKVIDLMMIVMCMRLKWTWTIVVPMRHRRGGGCCTSETYTRTQSSGKRRYLRMRVKKSPPCKDIVKFDQDGKWCMVCERVNNAHFHHRTRDD
jgi:hypothetical protein